MSEIDIKDKIDEIRRICRKQGYSLEQRGLLYGNLGEILDMIENEQSGIYDYEGFLKGLYRAFQWVLSKSKVRFGQSKENMPICGDKP